MDQKTNQLGIRKPKTEKSCSPSPPMLVVQNGVDESTAPKLESIDESSSSSTNSVSEKPICFFQPSDLSEMNSVLSLIKTNFPHLNVQVCLNPGNNSANRTKFLSPSSKQTERAFSIDSSFLNSIDRQESKDSGFWSAGKSSFDSTKSWSMSESYSTSLQTPSPPINQSKPEANENYLKSPSSRAGFKWKKGQAWRYNSNSSNVSTDCSTNCDEPGTQNTSLNLTSFESTCQGDSEPQGKQSLCHLGARFSNSFESNASSNCGLASNHLWASTSKLDEFKTAEAGPLVSSFTVTDGLNKASKRRGKLVRDQTIDNADEQPVSNITNSSVKLESTRFDSISSLISPLSISAKEPPNTSPSYKPNAFTSSSGRISPPEKRLSINNDKSFNSTPPSVSSSPAPPGQSLHDAVVAAVIAATIGKTNNNQQNELQYDFYKDLHKLNLKTNEEFNQQKTNSQFLSTGKLIARSSSSPNYSSSCSSIPSLQHGIQPQINSGFSPILNSFGDQNFYNSKSLSTCSIPVAAAAAAAAHFMNTIPRPSPNNENARFNPRPPEIVITESKIENDTNNKHEPFSFQFKQDESIWHSVNGQFLNTSRNQTNGDKQAKPHVCPSCQKRFARSDMLIRHSRLHSGVRPYRCNRCGQEFSRSDHLNTHLRTHTGEKPYSCPHPKCTYAACRKDMITRHMKVHNKNKNAMSFDNSGDKSKAVSTELGVKLTAYPSISFDSSSLNFANQQTQSMDKMHETSGTESARQTFGQINS